MKLKRLSVILIFLFLCVSVFADEKYAIKVKHADDMTVKNKLVTLYGNVQLELKISGNDDNEKNKTRVLNAQKIVFNLDEKMLQASGQVHLSEGKTTAFDGEVLALNWDTLDVVVFSGGSSSNKKNAQGNNVTFFSFGDKVSYEGETDSVFFENGVVATRKDDPYWSIKAGQIGMANSDLFFKNAMFKIGRVPFFWLPFFFYPGARLSINPAMGISSNKGMFLNTTYEVYGVYPKLNQTSTSSAKQDDENNGSQAAFALFSMLASGENGETIRDGYSYRSVNENEKLSKVETWARKTGSYLAVFGDAFENTGISVGFETKNKTKGSAIQMEALGVVGYRFISELRRPLMSYYNKHRYALDFKLTMNVDKSKFDITIPLYSDPNVKIDFLNRNTVFGLDSVFGKEQTLPSTYSSSVDNYTMKFNASTKISNKNYNFNVSNFDVWLKYKWTTAKQLYKYEVVEAQIPTFSIDSTGTIFNFKKEGQSKQIKLDTDLAQEYADEFERLTASKEDTSDTDTVTYEYADIGLAKIFSAPKYETTRSSGDSSIKLEYKYNQTFNNKYVSKLKHSFVSTTITPEINLSGNISSNIFRFKETVTPYFTGTFRDEGFNSSTFRLKSAFSASVPIAGLSYNLSTYAYIHTNEKGIDTERWGNWDNKDVLTHSIAYSNQIKNFSFSVTETLKPLREQIIPKISYSYSGFSFSADSTFDLGGDKWIEASVSHASIGYSKKYFNFSFSNTLNHKLDDFEGYDGTQSFTLNLYEIKKLNFLKNQKIKLTEKFYVHQKFKPKALELGAYYNDRNYLLFNFKDEELALDNFRMHLDYSLKPQYFWKNRIGFESGLTSNLMYSFKNKNASHFDVNFSMNFALNRFIDMKINVESENNGFYNYYDGDDFKFNKMWKDLIKSFDFFGDGRKSTHFKMKSMSVAFVHYLEDWNLIMEAKSNIKTINGKKRFEPEISVMVKWNAIPELKVENKYVNDKWEK